MSWRRSKDRDEEEVLLRSKDRRLVNCFGHLEHELVGRRAPQVLHRELPIVDNEAGVAQKVECRRTRDRSVAEVVLLVSSTDCPVL